MELNFESGFQIDVITAFFHDYEDEDRPEVFGCNEQKIKFSVRVKSNVIDGVVYREER